MSNGRDERDKNDLGKQPKKKGEASYRQDQSTPT